MTDETVYEQIAKDREHYLADHTSMDDDEWEAAPAPPRRRGGRLTTMVSVRLPAHEADEIRRAAEAEGLTVSAFVRAAALQRSHPRGVVSLPQENGTSSNVVRLVSFESDVPVNGTLPPALSTASA